MTDPKPSAEDYQRAVKLYTNRNARFALYREQDPTHGEDDVVWLANALSAAVSEAVESTVREAAKAMCEDCREGFGVLRAAEWPGRPFAHVDAGVAFDCYAEPIWSRWPALAPKEEK